MSYIGKTPTPAPLTSSDITDGIISTSKLADTSVTNAKINADIISAETELATAPADTDELLISDAGVLKRIDASLIGGGGITEADQWRISANKTNVQSVEVLDSNWERIDHPNYGKIGTGMSESSGIFTFPSTGIYFVSFHIMASGAGSNYISAKISVTSNNSSYTERAEAYANASSSSDYSNASSNVFLDVTDTSNVKVRFKIDSDNPITYNGSTNANTTYANFIRLGDT